MKNLINKIRTFIWKYYDKLQHLIMTIVVLGIIDLFAYYELAISLMSALAPELAPIIGLIFVWLIYKGIKKFIQLQKNKKYTFIF